MSKLKVWGLVLAGLVVLATAFSVFNYWVLQRPEVVVASQFLDLENDNMVLTSVARRGDFWNFLKSESEKTYSLVHGSPTIHILRYNDSVWVLEQVISGTNPMQGIDSYKSAFFAHDTESGNLLISAGTGEETVFYVLIKQGGGWSVEQAISRAWLVEESGVSSLSMPTHIGYTDSSFSGEGVIVLEIGSRDFYVLGRQGADWSLDWSMDKTVISEQPDGGQSASANLWNSWPRVVRSSGDRIALFAWDLLRQEEALLRFYIREGSSWSLEQNLDNSPVVKANFTAWTAFSDLEDDLFMLQGSEALYLFNWDGASWSLQQEISIANQMEALNFDPGSPSSSRLGGTNLALWQNDSLYILGRYDSVWRLEQEISQNSPLEGVDFEIAGPIMDIGDGFLAFEGRLKDSPEVNIYVLERDSDGVWRLAQTINLSTLLSTLD